MTRPTTDDLERLAKRDPREVGPYLPVMAQELLERRATPDRTATEIMIEFDRKHGPTQQTLLLFALSDWYEARKSFLALPPNDPSTRSYLGRLADAEQRLYSLAERLAEAAKEFAPK